MASFTDQIQTFNPYVQQLPVDAMAKVGMQKQAQYDAGVEKIQGYIDNVVGIEIMNGAQKQHLQSKINELGSKLKTVAAGDFSNQQLVNSVGGMASQIVKDPIVQTAMYSTKKAKENLELAERLYKEGKSSIDNVNYLRAQISAYANDPSVDAEFNGKYVNYIDLNKKWMDLADNLKKSAVPKSVDNPYKTDSLGRTIYYNKDAKGNIVTSLDPRQGKPMPDDATKRTTISGVSAQAMFDAMRADLTADDLEQMKVSAWAKYKGKGPETFVRDLTTSTQLAKDMLSQEIKKLNVDLMAGSKLTDEEKEEVQKNINKYQAKLDSGDLDKQLVENIEALNNPANLDKVKFDAYIKNTLNGKATTLSNQSFKEELVENIYAKAQHQRNVLQEQIRNNNMDYSVATATLAENRRSNRVKEEQWEKEYMAKYPSPIVQDRVISTNIDAPTVEGVSGDIATLVESKTTLDNEYGKFFKLNKPSLDYLFSKYQKDPASITGNNALKYVTARDIIERDIVRKNNIKKLAESASLPFDQEIDKTLEGIKGITGGDGKELFSAKDLYTVKSFVNNNFKNTSTSVYGGLVVSDSKLDEEKILKAVGNNPKQLAIARALVKNIRRQPLTPTEKVIYDQALALDLKVGPKISEINNAKFKKQAEVIANNDPNYQEQVASLGQNDKVDIEQSDKLIDNALQFITDQGSLDQPVGTQFTAAGIAKLRNSKEYVPRTIIKKSDGSGLLVIGTGDDAQVLPIKPDTFRQAYPKYAKTNPYNDDFKAIQANPYRTTNISDGPGDRPQDAVTAAHTGYEMPLLANTKWANRVRYDIIGDKQNDGDASSDRYGLRLFISNNGKWISVDSKGGFKNAATIQADIEQYIGPNTIESLLKKNK
jgi:hypothetical protein